MSGRNNLNCIVGEEKLFQEFWSFFFVWWSSSLYSRQLPTVPEISHIPCLVEDHPMENNEWSCLKSGWIWKIFQFQIYFLFLFRFWLYFQPFKVNSLTENTFLFHFISDICQEVLYKIYNEQKYLNMCKNKLKVENRNCI